MIQHFRLSNAHFVLYSILVLHQPKTQKQEHEEKKIFQMLGGWMCSTEGNVTFKKSQQNYLP